MAQAQVEMNDVGLWRRKAVFRDGIDQGNAEHTRS